MVLALRLPARVDSSEGEARPARRGRRAGDRARAMNGSVLLGLRANAALRGFSGFLLLYLAFLLRAQPIGGLPTPTMFALVAGAAAIGSFAGAVMGSLVKARAPEPIILTLLALQAAVTSASIFWYGAVSVVALSFTTGFSQQLAKLCLDAIIQRDVAESVRTSIFARAETLLQLAWVIGGIIGIALRQVPAQLELLAQHVERRRELATGDQRLACLLAFARCCGKRVGAQSSRDRGHEAALAFALAARWRCR